MAIRQQPCTGHSRVHSEDADNRQLGRYASSPGKIDLVNILLVQTKDRMQLLVLCPMCHLSARISMDYIINGYPGQSAIKAHVSCDMQ